MPTHFAGGVEARIRKLEERGRRCVGPIGGGRCVNQAVDEFDVIPMLHGLPNWGAPVETRKTCARHRLAVKADKSVRIVEHRPGVLKEQNAA